MDEEEGNVVTLVEASNSLKKTILFKNVFQNPDEAALTEKFLVQGAGVLTDKFELACSVKTRGDRKELKQKVQRLYVTENPDQSDDDEEDVINPILEEERKDGALFTVELCCPKGDLWFRPARVTVRALILGKVHRESGTHKERRWTCDVECGIAKRLRSKTDRAVYWSFDPRGAFTTSLLREIKDTILTLQRENEEYPEYYARVNDMEVVLELKNLRSAESYELLGAGTSFLRRDLARSYRGDDDLLFTDFELKCDGQSFPCHKHILACRSDVFKAMMTSDTKEAKDSCVDIVDSEPRYVRAMLAYLYTDRLPNDLDERFNLVQLAEKYNIVPLAELCWKSLSDLLAQSNVIKVYRLAKMFCKKKVEDEAANFLANLERETIKEVLRSEEWKALLKEDPDSTNFLIEKLL